MFSYFCSKHRLWVLVRWGGSNEYPQSTFLIWNKKNNVNPCKPKFYYIKVGFNGVKIIKACFRDVYLYIKSQFALYKPQREKTITKTQLYMFDPLKPHCYIIKLGFTGVYIIFLNSAQNIDCGYSLEPPRRGGSNGYPQSMLWAEIWKISEFFVWKFSVFGDEIFNKFE